MKRLINYIFTLTIIGLFATSCLPVETEYDETLLIGKWSSGTVFYRYDLGGNGASWDTSEDIQEVDAQAFTWALDKSTLTHIYVMEIGGSGVPKIYTVTTLSSTQLVYEDSFGKSFSFRKVQK